MRFCMITTFYPPYNFGGDGIFVQRLSNELARRGHHVEIVHCTDAYRLLAGHDPAPEPADHPNLVVHRLKSPFGFLSPLATQQTGRPLFKAAQLREILAQGFDVINFHNISLVGGPQVLEFGAGIKLYTLHEYWLVCPTHTLFKFNRAPCRDPQCLRCVLAHRRPPQLWRYTGLLQSAVRHVDCFISPSRFTQEIHHQMGLDIPMVHIPYFVPELPPASAADAGAAANEVQAPQPYFLYVGRLEKIKGLHTVLPVFRAYPQARLLVAGRGSDEALLKKMAGDAPNITFLGRLSHEQLGPLYRGAAAVIVPSVNYEVSPLVIFEAFQHGTPVIVRDIGGMPQLARDSGGGLVFATDAELRRALETLLGQPELRAAMGRRAYETYQAQLTPSAHVDTYMQLIGQLAANKPARASAAPLADDAPAARVANRS